MDKKDFKKFRDAIRNLSSNGMLIELNPEVKSRLTDGQIRIIREDVRIAKFVISSSFGKVRNG